MSIANGQGLSLPGSAGGGGASDFTDLLDTPSTYLGAAGYFLKVNGTEDGVEFTAVTVGDMLKATYDTNDDGKVDAADSANEVAGVTTAGNSKYYGTNGVGAAGFYDLPTDTDTFTGLTDTPANYTGAGGDTVRVNSGGTALEFVDTNVYLAARGGVDTTATAKLQWGTIVTSAGITYDGTNREFTVPEDGKYVILWQSLTSAAATRVQATINRTSTAPNLTDSSTYFGNVYMQDSLNTLALTCTESLLANDTIQLWVTSGTIFCDSGTGNVANNITIFKIGD